MPLSAPERLLDKIALSWVSLFRDQNAKQIIDVVKIEKYSKIPIPLLGGISEGDTPMFCNT